MPNIVAIEKSGRDIYYTPLDDKYHFMLIDDVKPEKLKQLVGADGYAPAVVIESSPDNYQVILKVPKLGIDEQIENSLANKVVRELNVRYGDPNLSGARHPHRAPGFRNLKEKHRRDDGTYPEVKLIGARDKVYSKCKKRPRDLYEDERARAAYRNKETRERIDRARQSVSRYDYLTPLDAYFRHATDIMNRMKVRDWNRLDAMIAVRMSVTGYTPGQIEEAVRTGAPVVRGESGTHAHNWPDYARRTANYVSRPEGQKKILDAASYLPYYLKVEGRSLRKRDFNDRTQTQAEQFSQAQNRDMTAAKNDAEMTVKRKESTGLGW